MNRYNGLFSKTISVLLKRIGAERIGCIMKKEVMNKETVEMNGKKVTFEMYESENLKTMKIQGDLEIITNKECFDKMTKFLSQTKEEEKNNE